MLFNKRKSFTPLVVSSVFFASHCLTVMAAQTGIVHTYDLNIRETTSTSSKILGVVKKGSSVEILSKQGDFYKIKYNGVQGYVMSKYIQVNESIPSEKVLKYGKVSLHGLQVRGSASDNSKLITLLEKDTLLEIYETKGAWHRIKVDGNDAWVYMGYVLDIEKPTTEIPKLVSKKYGKVNYEGLQVRSKASDNSELVTVLQKDTLLEIEAIENLWYKIKVDGNDAWVYMGYVDLISKPTSTIPSIESKKYGKVNLNGLQVRSAASDNSTLITTLPKDTLIEIEGFNGVWYKIKVDGNDAWVYIGYVDLIQKPTSAIPPISTNEAVISQGTVTSNDTLNVRTGPAATYDKVGELPSGTKVDIYETKNNWHRIKANGLSGWVSGNYIKIIVPTVINKGTVHTYDINARVDANYTSTVIGTIKNGTTIDIYEVNGSWYKVKVNGKFGWVPGTYVTLNNSSNNNTDNNNTSNNMSENKNYARVGKTLTNYLDSQEGRLIITTDGGNGSFVNATREQLKYYADPNTFENHSRGKYQFLTLNKGRSVDVNKLNNYLNTMKVTSGKVRIFDNKAQAFVDAGKKYNVDPIYLVSHTILESGYGTSKLAQGYEVVLDENGVALRDEEGFVVIKNSETPTDAQTVKVHNLFGIGAVDSNPTKGGVTKAYEEGWTTVDKAIEGSASWISNGYINSSKYKQNTLYKMRFNYNVSWHQYATDIGWAYKISSKMSDLAHIYTSSLDYEVPVYNEDPIQTEIEEDKNEEVTETYISEYMID